jgi:hypothetical protein
MSRKKSRVDIARAEPLPQQLVDFLAFANERPCKKCNTVDGQRVSGGKLLECLTERIPPGVDGWSPVVLSVGFWCYNRHRPVATEANASVLELLSNQIVLYMACDVMENLLSTGRLSDLTCCGHCGIWFFRANNNRLFCSNKCRDLNRGSRAGYMRKYRRLPHATARNRKSDRNHGKGSENDQT